MSHNIKFFSYAENVNRVKVQRELNDYVAHEDWQEGCSGLPRNIRWLEDVNVCEDRNAAEAMIEIKDRNNYDQLAVRYYQNELGQDLCNDEKHRELSDAVIKACNVYRTRADLIYPKTYTAQFVGCKNCGSKLSVKYLKSNRCPLCGHDLRPDHILKAIEAAHKKWDNAQKKLKDYENKKSKKKVMWLVKIEYHT